LDQINEVLHAGLNNSQDFDLIPDRLVRREYDALMERHRIQDDSLLFGLGRQLRADYVITGHLSTENPNTYQVAARMLDIKGNTVLPPLSFEGSRRLGSTLMANLVVRIASSLRENFSPGQRSGKTEIAVDFSSVTPDVAEQGKPESGRILSFNEIIYGGVSLPADLKSMSSLLGLDLIFDIEQTYFSFGAGASLLGMLSLDLSLFLEAHLYENNQSVATQMYFRAGAGYVHPLDTKIIKESDIKILALIGARHISSHFVFDVGFGIDYFSTRVGAFCLRAGIGLYI